MPLFAYFGVVGSLLVGLLYVAEARLGPPAALSISTNFHGIPAPFKAAANPILTVREAPAPKISTPAAAQPAVAEQPSKTLKTAKVASRTRKNSGVVHHAAGRNVFAAGGAVPGTNHRIW